MDEVRLMLGAKSDRRQETGMQQQQGFIYRLSVDRLVQVIGLR